MPIQYPLKKKRFRVQQPEDNEELAKTAGALLDSVKGDQSQKFRENNFLALMRRLRDQKYRSRAMSLRMSVLFDVTYYLFHR